MESFLAWNQSVRLGNSLFNVFSITFILCEKKMLVSSANRMNYRTHFRRHVLALTRRYICSDSVDSSLRVSRLLTLIHYAGAIGKKVDPLLALYSCIFIESFV